MMYDPVGMDVVDSFQYLLYAVGCFLLWVVTCYDIIRVRGTEPLWGCIPVFGLLRKGSNCIGNVEVRMNNDNHPPACLLSSELTRNT